jgi:hypothetical protein
VVGIAARLALLARAPVTAIAVTAAAVTATIAIATRVSSSSAPVSWSTTRIDRRTLPRGSISRTLTKTSWPSLTTSVGFSTRSFFISET